MQLENKDILLISPEPWDHIFVSKRHYAVHLAEKGNRVCFLNPPTKKTQISETIYKNLWQVDYSGFPKGLRFYPLFLRNFFIRKAFRHLQVLAKVEFDIIWSFDNSVFYDFSALPTKVFKISHIVDLNQNFQTAKAAASADLCLCTTSFIKNLLLKYSKNVWQIGHGYSDGKLTGELIIPHQEEEIKVGYAGNLNIKYIDWELVANIIESNPNIQFYFAGTLDNPSVKQLFNNYKNVTYIGKLNKDELVSFYSKMDLLILAYKADQYKEQLANPHKMMEYLASGKMIVTTHTQEYKELVEDGLFLMSNQNKEYPQLFQSAFENLAYWNSEKMRNVRRTFALGNTYDKQIDRIENYIANA